jgi:hypothetical protein
VRIGRSLALVHRSCLDTFEAGNLRLIAERGWPTDHFIPPMDEDFAGEADIAELDHLWAPEASPAERALLYAALARIVSA